MFVSPVSGCWWLSCSVGSLYAFWLLLRMCVVFFFFQAEDGIRDLIVTGVQTCALPIYLHGLDAGRHLHPGHVLHRRAHPLRRLRRLDLRCVRGDLLLVPEDVRPDDEHEIGRAHV